MQKTKLKTAENKHRKSPVIIKITGLFAIIAPNGT